MVRVLVMGSPALLLPLSGRASVYLQDQSARGISRAYSGEGADQGPDQMWWPVSNGLLPSTAAALRLGQWAIGLAVTSPFSFIAEHDPASWARDAALTSALPNLSPTDPDVTETFHGQGWNVGYNLGFQLHLLDDRLTFDAANCTTP